ncbi:hypothetical protein D6D28_02939 [Aureobasidium pullulans]|uniref:Uncharacterized protein n=1 Tax=Aureobasidium pullulans TaxID=5580 RepID=A0A4S8SS74_AURPU|nr:hypothetical protein D6D28_02939 [Aureobasidium pullulans]
MPAQINVKPEMTVEAFIQGRATALRELIPNLIFLQYGLANIAATSSAAQDAVQFSNALNMVPPQSASLTTTEEKEESFTIRLEPVISNCRVGLPLKLYSRLVGGGMKLCA